MNTELLNKDNKENQRLSSIEIFKIFGIFLVVLSHVLQTLCTFSGDLEICDYYINIDSHIDNISNILLLFLKYSGAFGNMIFFTCSAWFLVGKKELNFKKILRLMLDVLVISILWLIPMLILKGYDEIGSKMLLESLTPTISCVNWYVTIYILFCLSYPFINLIIIKLNKVLFLVVSLVLLIIFNFVCIFYHFFDNSYFSWISIYLIISFIKMYHPKLCDNKLFNICLIIIGIIGFFSIVLYGNFVGFILNGEKVGNLYLTVNGNIFILSIVFGVINLIKNINYINKHINYISSLSLLVYIIHENNLFRHFIRPVIWHEIYANFGHEYVVVWSFIYAIVLCLVATILSIIYNKTIQKYIHRFGEFLGSFLEKILAFIINYFKQKFAKKKLEHE